VPIVPSVRGLRFQSVHGDDVADAYRRAVVSDAAGAFNIAAEPVLRIEDHVAPLLTARPVPRLAPGVARALVELTWRARLQPTPPGWLDMGMHAPLLRSDRARAELGWAPTIPATEALAEVLRGLREGAGDPTPPLRRHAGGRARIRELATAVGGRPGVHGS
jgi:UDP-glucose 4-epimerase